MPVITIAGNDGITIEKKREILFNIPVDDVVDRRSSNVSSNDGKVMCKRKD